MLPCRCIVVLMRLLCFGLLLSIFDLLVESVPFRSYAKCSYLCRSSLLFAWCCFQSLPGVLFLLLLYRLAPIIVLF